MAVEKSATRAPKIPPVKGAAIGLARTASGARVGDDGAMAAHWAAVRSVG
tara:strand:+ start:231 stop:380 length:150 start_codon:yes stop_codon:yes gene_type:complete